MSEAGKDAARNGIQVIERAARILRALKQTPSGMSLGQIAEAVSLPRSTVQRIVNALMDEDLVAAGAKAGRIRLGPEIAALAEHTRHNVAETCRLILTELSQDTGETADLSAMRGGAMVFLDQVAGTHRLRTVSAIGDAFPLTTTANGRACLAELDPDDARRMVREEWDRRGVEGDMDAFMDRLDDIRRTGLAYDLDEHTQGISAIGVAFRDWSDSLYAISIPIPSSRFPSVERDVEAALLKARQHARSLIRSD